MKLELVKNIKGNEILEENIYNTKGALMLPKGCKLEVNMKKKLVENGVFYIYISESEDKKGSNIKDFTTSEEKLNRLKQDTLSKLPNVFNDILDKNIESMGALVDVVDEMVIDIMNSDIINTKLFEINTYDDYTYIHCLDTALMSIFLGKALNIDINVVRTIGLSAILHDIGKTRIPNSIINKKGRLTPFEYEIIKQHSRLGYDALLEAGLKTPEILYGVLHHHERYDGTGYPSGLKGSNTNIIAKIISVSDVYTAVAANRSYRKRFSPNDAYECILAGVGTLFDPIIIGKYRETFSIYPIGCHVILSNGVNGIVVKQNKNFPDRPIVQGEKQDISKKKYIYNIDLVENSKITIIDAK